MGLGQSLMSLTYYAIDDPESALQLVVELEKSRYKYDHMAKQSIVAD